MNAQAARHERPGVPCKRPGLAAPEVNWYIQKATYPQNNCGIGSCMFIACSAHANACHACLSHACHACLSRMLCYPAMARGMRAMRGDEGDEAAPWRAARMGAGQQGCRGQQRRAGQQGVEVRS